MPILRPIKLWRVVQPQASIPASPTDVVGRANTGLLTPMVVLNPAIIRASFPICPTVNYYKDFVKLSTNLQQSTEF